MSDTIDKTFDFAKAIEELGRLTTGSRMKILTLMKDYQSFAEGLNLLKRVGKD